MTTHAYCLAPEATLALHEGCGENGTISLSCMRELLFMRADIDSLDADGYTPLMKAAMHGNLDKVNNLLACGARVDVSGPNGQDALHLAMSRGHREVYRTLMRAYNKPIAQPAPVATAPARPASGPKFS